MSKLTRSEAAKIKGVSVSTLRRWEAEGKLTPERTLNGHRRYDLAQLLGVKSDSAITIGYARVSSHDQKSDLEIITVFSARLYGSRSHKNKKVVEELREIAQKL
ncbi:MAG: MerR family DNA-binding transcriptional regulator [Phormidium sp.]